MPSSAVHRNWHEIIRRNDSSDSVPGGYWAFLPASLQVDSSFEHGATHIVCNWARNLSSTATLARVQFESDNDPENVSKTAHFCGTSRLSSVSEIMSGTFGATRASRTRHRWIWVLTASSAPHGRPGPCVRTPSHRLRGVLATPLPHPHEYEVAPNDSESESDAEGDPITDSTVHKPSSSLCASQIARDVDPQQHRSSTRTKRVR
ncbi:hypothetical protein C8R45DRAFT_598363 [Mycena sanguinolenta]|nr:hypothetical protein C8R45DRAFT_598363 [Mycena sanguinolenta]